VGLKQGDKAKLQTRQAGFEEQTASRGCNPVRQNFGQASRTKFHGNPSATRGKCAIFSLTWHMKQIRDEYTHRGMSTLIEKIKSKAHETEPHPCTTFCRILSAPIYFLFLFFYGGGCSFTGQRKSAEGSRKENMKDQE